MNFSESPEHLSSFFIWASVSSLETRSCREQGLESKRVLDHSQFTTMTYWTHKVVWAGSLSWWTNLYPFCHFSENIPVDAIAYLCNTANLQFSLRGWICDAQPYHRGGKSTCSWYFIRFGQLWMWWLLFHFQSMTANPGSDTCIDLWQEMWVMFNSLLKITTYMVSVFLLFIH